MRLRRLFHKNKQLPAVEILHAGPRQNFSPRLIGMGEHEGWLETSGSRLVIHSTDGDVEYVIEREPGYYCCFCNKKLPDGPSGRQHVHRFHVGNYSPDRENPAGYRRDNFYACKRVDGGEPESPSTFWNWLKEIASG